jgi:anti-sigma B factor antagonist
MTDERSIEVAGLGIQVEQAQDRALLKLSGELSVASADALDAEFQRIEATAVPKIVVDLSGLRFIDSVGIRVMYSAAVRLRDNDRLRVVPGPESVQRIFRLSGMSWVFPFTGPR